MAEHALLSPSSASRWLNCTPSARLTESFPGTTSAAAEEGTLAHALCEVKAAWGLGLRDLHEGKQTLDELLASPLYTKEMDDCSDVYVAYLADLYMRAKKRSKDANVMLETRLDFTEYVHEGFGTADGVIYADGILEVVDFKYGKGVPVSSEDNAQLKIYGLGALNMFALLYDIHTVRLHIVQPRIDNTSCWEIATLDLLEWGENELKVKAKIAFAGEGPFITGSHCRFCPAAAQCKTLAEHNLMLAKYEFLKANLLKPAEVADILTRAPGFKTWITSVENYALEAALQGEEIPGYKVVEGRSVRAISDADGLVAKIVEAGYPESLCWERKFATLTALEAAIGKKTFKELSAPYITKPQGKPTLVPESDKRPALSSAQSAINDFKNVKND